MTKIEELEDRIRNITEELAELKEESRENVYCNFCAKEVGISHVKMQDEPYCNKICVFKSMESSGELEVVTV